MGAPDEHGAGIINLTLCGGTGLALKTDFPLRYQTVLPLSCALKVDYISTTVLWTLNFLA